MTSLFESIYDKSDLERRTRLFYEAYISKSSNIQDVFKESFGIKYELVFSNAPYVLAVFSLLKRYYRNEFYIKKSFTIQHLFKPQSVAFTEFPINDSRADIVSINRNSTAYEIKTSFDNLFRLSKQIDDYSKCFEYVYVICSANMYEQVIELTPEYCGIYVYDNLRISSAFKKVKEATLSPNLSPKSMLASITKDELSHYFGESSREDVCKLYSLTDTNKLYKKILKNRYYCKWNSYKHECNLIRTLAH